MIDATSTGCSRIPRSTRLAAQRQQSCRGHTSPYRSRRHQDHCSASRCGSRSPRGCARGSPHRRRSRDPISAAASGLSSIHSFAFSRASMNRPTSSELSSSHSTLGEVHVVRTRNLVVLPDLIVTDLILRVCHRCREDAQLMLPQVEAACASPASSAVPKSMPGRREGHVIFGDAVGCEQQRGVPLAGRGLRGDGDGLAPEVLR